MSYELHDLFRDRLTALPLTAGRRGIAAMVMVEIVRWMSDTDYCCTRTAGELADLLRLRPGDVMIALQTLGSLGIVGLDTASGRTVIQLLPLAAGKAPAVLCGEITEATGFHAAWKRRLRQAIDSGQSEMSVDEVGDDQGCAFGRWLRSAAFSGADGDREYETVCQLHTQFHRVAAATLQLALAGNRKEAEHCMAAGGIFAETSARLMRALGGWKRQIRP
ncbi:MAG: CZB domain-containing protein [Rhodospirillaceae bacterium]